MEEEIYEEPASGASRKNSDVEEGEVEEAEEATEKMSTSKERTLAFEIKFSQKNYFNQYGSALLAAIDNALNGPHLADQQRFEFLIQDNEKWQESAADTNSVCVCAYMVEASEQEMQNDSISMPNDSAADAIKISAGTVEDESEIVAPAIRESSPDLDLSDLFTVDTVGSVKLDTIKVPSYKRAIRDVLDEESAERKRQKQEEEEEPVRCARPRPTAACFNCGSSQHGLRDCTKPRNNMRINRAKKAFSSKQERYHADVEQRFAHLRPGVISEKLQAALGLRRGELPFFFYRMRVLGYPPGWLEDAKVAASGMALFNSDGNAVEQSDEEGVLDDHKYNVSKIIDFPGFNADPGPNFYDDYEHHNVPPMDKQQMKDEFIKTLGDNIIKGYRRKKLKNLPDTIEGDNSAVSMELENMEVEDPEMATDANVVFTRPLPPPEPANSDEQPPLPPPTSPPADNNESSPDEERPQSPTLAHLEAQQRKLLAELQNNISNVTAEPDDSLIDEVLALENTQSSLNATNCDNSQESKSSEAASADRRSSIGASTAPSTPTTPSTPGPSASTRRSDAIKESHMGTPLLKFSPFDKLPAGDNFKVGVSDVINFENLPDSTGKYEQMKTVIKKVRKIVTQMQCEDED